MSGLYLRHILLGPVPLPFTTNPSPLSKPSYRPLFNTSIDHSTTCRTPIEAHGHPKNSSQYTRSVMSAATSTGSPADRRASASKSFSQDENIKNSIELPQALQVSCRRESSDVLPNRRALFPEISSGCLKAPAHLLSDTCFPYRPSPLSSAATPLIRFG